MDAIRRQQISEVLNYDRNMNLRVLDLEKKQVATMQDERTPYVQQDQQGIDNTNTLINNLMVLLDRKRSSTTTSRTEPYITPPRARDLTPRRSPTSS